MSENGKNIRELVIELRRLFREISELLGSADKLIGEEDWSTASNRAIANQSYNYSAPRKWFPNEVFRFYNNPEYPNILAFVSVMLDDREDAYENFTEPVLAAGWFDFGKGVNAEKEHWDYWYARFHGYKEGRKDDGTLQEQVPDDETRKQNNYKFETAYTFGVPLVSVKDTEDLKNKIVDPLVKGIREKTAGL